MITVLVTMYLGSPTTLVRLEKQIQLPALPRAGEWMKFENQQEGDHILYQVRDVIYRERGNPSIVLEFLKDGPSHYLLLEEDELSEFIASYVAEGWVRKSEVSNRTFLNDGSS